MSAELGPSFRWGVITRRSQLNADGTEGSTARQERAIHEFIKAHNMGQVVAVYTDIASGYDEKAKREDFRNSQADLKAGRVDGLISWKVDRLTRRRSEARRLLTLAEECGGRLATVVEGIDTADPAKKEITEIALAIYAGSAESEAEAIGERVRLSHLDRATKGLTHRGPHRPFGHSHDWFSLVPAEVKLLHELGERVLKDEGLFSCARDWTARAVPTTKGGTRWHSDVMRRMLLSPRMVAKREYGGTLYDLRDVPPIFDVKTWEAICAKLAVTKTNERLTVHLLSNLAQCGKCSRTLLTNRSGRKSTLVYACRPHFEGDTSACGKLNVVARYAEARVREEVVAFLADKERVTALLRKHATPELEAVHARIAELSESLYALGQALNPPPGVPRMALETYYEHAATIENERKALHHRLAVSREAAVLTEVLGFEDAEKEWDARSQAWRRTILKLVCESIVIEPRGKASVAPGRNVFDPSRVRVKFCA